MKEKIKYSPSIIEQNKNDEKVNIQMKVEGVYKVKEKIEEDMKMLERIDVKFFLTGTVEQSDYIVDKADEVNNAIENILSDYKRVLKENEELKKFITEGITIEPNSPYKNYRLDFLRENFIPVQKLKDKIEELEPELKFEITEREARLQINLLKSLLKEG